MAVLDVCFEELGEWVAREDIRMLQYRFGGVYRLPMPNLPKDYCELKPQAAFMLFAADVLGWRDHLITAFTDDHYTLRKYWDGSQCAFSIGERQRLNAHFCVRLAGIWLSQVYISHWELIGQLTDEICATTGHYVTCIEREAC